MIARSRAGSEVIGGVELDDDDIDLDRWTRLARAVLDDEGFIGELGLTFVDESAMAVLNADHMGENRPTDVLAFPLDAAGDEVGGAPGELRLLGDVVVCPTVARRHAQERAIEPDDELALLVVHGVLHVIGHDHAEPDEEALMKERERHHLEHHHRSSPARPDSR